MKAVIASLKGFASVSELLRLCGAFIIVASMSLYLLQGWSEGNDIARYLKLLCQTGLLGLAGLVLSHGLREARGARAFFGLALISVPANFTILGALLYSLMQLDGSLTPVPAFATWHIGALADVGLTLVGALAVLAPVTVFCFLVMARRSAMALTGHFLALNLLLLIPVRATEIAAVIAVAGGCYALWAIRRMLRADRTLTTREGRFALTLLTLPPGIILFRSLAFYGVESLTVALLAATAYLGLRQMSRVPVRLPGLAPLLDWLSLVAAGVTVLSLMSTVAPALHTAVLAPLAGIAFAVFCADIALRTSGRLLKQLAAVLMSLAVSTGFILGVSLEPSAGSALAGLLAGVALVLAGRWFAHTGSVVFGGLTLLCAMSVGYRPLIDLAQNANWIAMALVGAAAIGLGSLIERHGVALRLNIERWTGKVRERVHC